MTVAGLAPWPRSRSIPLIGAFEAESACPIVGRQMRKRGEGGRYAGLRILAQD